MRSLFIYNATCNMNQKLITKNVFIISDDTFEWTKCCQLKNFDLIYPVLNKNVNKKEIESLFEKLQRIYCIKSS